MPKKQRTQKVKLSKQLKLLREVGKLSNAIELLSDCRDPLHAIYQVYQGTLSKREVKKLSEKLQKKLISQLNTLLEKLKGGK